MIRAPLAGFVSPTAIAVFGASPDPATLGGVLTRNLLEGGFAGQVHLINPRHREILGHPCHPDIAAIDARIDLALVVAPAHAVRGIVEQCGRKHIRFAVIHSTGFAEAGEIGACVEADLAATARRLGVRLMGPRALGFIRPSLGLNATLFYRRLPAGNLAFVSQSSSVCVSVLDWAFNNDFALSAVFGPGHGGDIDLPEILDFLAGDPETESILLYLEGVRASRPFMSALRAAARSKPVVVVKAGRGAAAALAERHVLAKGGRDETFDAALRRAGALRVASIGDLFTAARALSSPRKPAGHRLAIISNGGGPAVMAADAAEAHGVQLAGFTPATRAHLAMRLPLSWSAANPIDLLLDADSERFAIALAAALADPGVDGAVVIVSPSGLADAAAIARREKEIRAAGTKPVLVCLLGETSVVEGRKLLAAAGIPVFRTAESAVAAFAFMADFVRNQRLLLETPPSVSPRRAPAVAEARVVIDFALQAGRRVLSEVEAAKVATAFHLHLAKAGGGTAAGDLLLRLDRDPAWGPVLGLYDGGPRGEPLCDAALPPLNERLAGDLLADRRIGALLAPLADPGEARRHLRELLQRVAEMACELPWITALDLRLRLADGLPAAAFTIAVEPWSGAPGRYEHMAVSPYPLGLEKRVPGRAGGNFRIRPVRPEDAAAFQEFVRGLGEKARYYRFFGSLRELPALELARHTQIDYDREMVLVATADEGDPILGEAGYTVLADGTTGEFGVVVADAVAGQGLGSHLMECLMETARQRGLRSLAGEVIQDNRPMLALMAALGFTVAPSADKETVTVSRKLG